jgi:aspartate aminotransferase
MAQPAPSTLRLSSRVARLKPPATLAIMAKAKSMAREGIEVISFGLGEPDFDTPTQIRQAAIEALSAGQTHYMPTIGDPETRSVIAGKLARENGIPDLGPANIAISVGAKHSLYLVAQCLLGEEGSANEVLMPVPAWVSYPPIVELAGGKVVELPTTVDSNFKITPEQLRRAITPRSRILLLNSPNNPCGTMYSPEELRALAAAVADAAATTAPQLVIVTDEIYEKITYGGIPHFSIGSISAVAHRTVTINGLSKAYAMTGWRIGYTAAPGEFGRMLIQGIDALQGQMTSCITSFLYPAIRTALRECAADHERFRDEFARRASVIYDLVRQIPGLNCPRPTGAFYLFPDVSAHFGKRSAGGRAVTESVSFAEALLEEAHVAVVPGAEFGGVGNNHIRISFACSEGEIRTGMDRLARFVGALK